MITIDRIFSVLSEWSLNTIVIVSIVFILMQLKRILHFIFVKFFGKEKTPNYKEIMSSLGFVGIFIMVIKHLLDPSYKPDMTLLIFFGFITLTMAEFDKLLEIIKPLLLDKINKISKKEEENEMKD